MNQSSGADPATPNPAPPARTGMRGTSKSMVISTIVLFLAVAVWMALVPRPDRVERPTMDDAAIAAQTATRTQWQIAVLPVNQMGSDWIPTDVRLTAIQSHKSWQAGYTGPERGYIALWQSHNPPATWQNKLIGAGKEVGEFTCATGVWKKWQSSSEGTPRSLVRTEKWAGLDTVVIGSGAGASWEAMQKFACELQQVKPQSSK